MRITYCGGGNGSQTRCIAFVEDIGSLAIPESGLRAHLDHFLDIVGVCRFEPNSCDLRIAVEIGPKPTVLHLWNILGA